MTLFSLARSVTNRRVDGGLLKSSSLKIHLPSTTASERWPTSARHSVSSVYSVDYIKFVCIRVHSWLKMIETKRLKIYPATKEQMEAAIASERDDELKKAYSEMLGYSLNHPAQWEWYAMWMIELKGGTHIGDLCFKGLEPNGVAEIGYGILEEYQGCGYATEAVQAVVDWAFQHPYVTALEAETAPDNSASKRVLEKCGFIANGKIGEEGPRFTLNRR